MKSSRFESYRIGKKLSIGFGVLLVLIVVIGVISLVSMNNITYQLEIAKNANRALTDAQDTQAASLRYILYNDVKYNDIIVQEQEKVLSTLANTKSMMGSAENKQKAASASEAMSKYKAANGKAFKILTQKGKAGLKNYHGGHSGGGYHDHRRKNIG